MYLKHIREKIVIRHKIGTLQTQSTLYVLFSIFSNIYFIELVSLAAEKLG